MIEFRAWPKIARLYRDIVVTEKIDGTNAAIGILAHVDIPNADTPDQVKELLGIDPIATATDGYLVYAQSRNRVITPKADNHGFAAWVYDNADALVEILGVGLHFGEWWGAGINRSYGLTKGEHRFSLFNTSRWHGCTQRDDCDGLCAVEGLGVVPILYQGDFSTLAVQGAMEQLRLGGSAAAPQFMRPEGVVVYHTAANAMFKATLEDDAMPKVLAMRKPRELRNVRLVKVSLDHASPYAREDLTLAA